MTNVSARAWRGHRSSDRLPAKVFDDASSAADGTWPAGGEGDLSPLVPAARSGDQEAFRLLYRAVQPLLLRYLRTLVGDDAEDVASEAWLQIARDLGSFQGDYDGFRGWAATIARHRAMDHLRRMRRRPSTLVPLEEFRDLADQADPAMQAMQSMSTEAAIRLIGTLPRDQAEAVLLRAVMGLDAATAGQVLGKRSGAVRTAAYRGLRRLAARLRQAEVSLSERPLAEKGVTSGEAAALRTVR
ncbi:RNA polymerase sigma-70 factor, ECF subfamily [Micromonospora rhizosphaerae]|uniref:RNA polymerase sigma-70 factor, ECF subfamily n=1 Tax=Micromonospora rhizosphaerae TaxID=568872 RepID=A0A1C6R8R6_9ACTN|nr:RNA polymerase sigma-70 factor, ECF subfamily [Micromonospora rhizosphaerae]